MKVSDKSSCIHLSTVPLSAIEATQRSYMHPSQLKLMQAIQANPKITIRGLMEAAGISSTSLLDYHLKALMRAGYVKRLKGFKVLKAVEATDSTED